MKYTCEQVETLAAGLVDKELDAEAYEGVVTHLRTCPNCAGMVKAQEQIKKSIQRGYRIEPAPVHLRSRVRRLLSEGPRVPGFLDLLTELFAFHRAKSALAAAILFAVIALPYLQLLSPGEVHQAAEKQFVTLQGKVVCVDCEYQHAAGHLQEHTPDHKLGIRSDAGQLWQVVSSGLGKEFIHDFGLMGQWVTVEGYAIRGLSGNLVDIQRLNKL